MSNGEFRMRQAVAAALVCAAAAFAQEGERRKPKTESRKTDATRRSEEVTTLIDQLGAADYEDREAADARLREIGMEALEPLAERFQRRDDYEASLRIQRIAEYIYFWDRVLGKNGFLGIQHRKYADSTYYQPNDERVPPDTAAFAIERVIEGTSADRAGLQKGDVIIAVDGHRLPATAELTAFADQIRGKPPGTKMVFDLWRGEEFMSQPITIGHRPPSYYYRGQAPRDLQDQFNAAVKAFPVWWVPRFGAISESSRTGEWPSTDGFEYYRK